MNISFFGHACFKLRSASCSLVTDPTRMPKTEADIVTISRDNPDHNDLTRFKNQPFVIKAPGEYEIKGVSVFGYPAFFIIQMEGVKICHLAFLESSLSQEQLDEIDGVDILLVGINPKVATSVKIINQIEPSIVIPMQYGEATLQEFLKEFGQEGETVDRLVVTKASLPEETKLFILQRKT